MTFHQVSADKPVLYTFHVSRWNPLITQLFIQLYVISHLKNNIASRNKNGCTPLSRNILCKLLVNHQHILLTSQGSSCIKRGMQTIWRICFFYSVFTAFTVKFYHILLHIKAGNQQKNLLPVCKLIIVIPRDNISFQSWQNLFRTSVESTPLTRCLFGTNCWILICWLYYASGLDITANPPDSKCTS